MKGRDVYLHFLANIPMFSACTGRDLELIADRAEPVHLQSGDAVFNEGDAGEHFFVVADGKLRVLRGGAEVASLGSGDFFGELALFDESPRNATVEASTAAWVMRLGRDDLHELLGEVPAMRERILRGMARRLHSLDAKA